MNCSSNTRYDNSGSLRNYVLKIGWVANRLRKVKIPMTDDFIVHHVLDSLSVEYRQLKVSYTAL